MNFDLRSIYGRMIVHIDITLEPSTLFNKSQVRQKCSDILNSDYSCSACLLDMIKHILLHSNKGIGHKLLQQ